MENKRVENDSRLAELRTVLVLLGEARGHAENLGSPEDNPRMTPFGKGCYG